MLLLLLLKDEAKGEYMRVGDSADRHEEPGERRPSPSERGLLWSGMEA